MSSQANSAASEDQGYSAKRAAEIVSITYRQLDYWTRTDLVTPSFAKAEGSGSRRLYAYKDLLELRSIKSLLDAGIKLELVREVVEYLREELDQDISTANLVISGSQVLIRSGEEIIDLLRGGQGVLNVLPLAGVKEQVDAAIIELFPQTVPSAGAAPVAEATGS